MKKTFLKLAATIALMLVAAVNPVQAVVVSSAPVDSNLLANPSCDNADFTAWTCVNGGSGWSAWDLNWKSSHVSCSMYQIVDFLTAGFTETQLDALPYLTASGSFYCPWAGNYPGYAKIIVYLLDASDNTLETLTVKDTTYSASTTGDIPWAIYSKQIQIPTGTRKAKFYFEGQDSKSWGGQYGPNFDDMWLSLSTTSGFATKSVNCATVSNGTFSVDKSTPSAGDTVKITASPSANCSLDTIIVTKVSGGPITLLTDSTFIMPFGYDVTVSGEFKSATSSVKQNYNTAYKVYVQGNNILVEGTEGETVNVYNITGDFVVKGKGDMSVVVNSGVYVVKIGNAAYKVLVK